MIWFVMDDSETAINLFQKDHTHQLVGKCHFRKTDAFVCLAKETVRHARVIRRSESRYGSPPRIPRPWIFSAKFSDVICFPSIVRAIVVGTNLLTLSGPALLLFFDLFFDGRTCTVRCLSSATSRISSLQYLLKRFWYSGMQSKNFFFFFFRL